MRLLLWATGILVAMAICLPSANGQERKWRVPPAYETGQPVGQLGWTDEDGEHILYSESYAVLLLQGNYENWSSPAAAARISEALLVKALEKRNFHVLAWRDLASDDFQDLTRELGARFSRTKNSRFFFYYFGHGTTLPTGDRGQQEFYLVPVDAPGTAAGEDFVFSAISATSLFADLTPLNAKHAFFAFEACKSGGVLQTLTDKPPADRRGFLTSSAMDENVRQYLTAGNAVQLVPATNSFTTVLVDGLSSSNADSNEDLYISGNEMMAYVSGTLPNRNKGVYPQDPEMGSSGAGNFVFGPIDPDLEIPSLGPSPDATASSGDLYPMFKGLVSPGDIDNDRLIAFLASNRRREVYVNLLVDLSMISAGAQVMNHCSKALGLPSADDEESTGGELEESESIYPNWEMPLPRRRASTSIYGEDTMQELRSDNGDVNASALDCSAKLTLHLATEPRYIGCGSNCLYYRVDGVFMNEVSPSGAGGFHIVLSEVPATDQRLRVLKSQLDKDFPEPFEPFEVDP